MPVVRVSLLAGRTKDQKAELAKAITEDIQRIIGARPEATTIIFEDRDKEDWASGGVLMCDKQS
jgi:4-oxalocrotonate tautomerase